MTTRATLRPRAFVAVVVGTLATLAFVLLVHEVLLVRYGAWLVREDDLDAADLVVVLGGHSGFRVLRGVELVREGRAGRLAMTAQPAEFPRFERPSAERWFALAESLGVAPTAIDVLTPSYSTFDDAWLARRHAESQGYTRLAFVTDPYHSRRAAWVVDRVFSETTIEVAMIPSRPPWFEPAAWWKDERQFLAVTLEYAKLAYYAYAYGLAGHIGQEPGGFHVRTPHEAAPGGADQR